MAACDWHKGWGEVDGPSCPECGKLLSIKDCEGCGKTFLDWDARGYDDIVAAPASTNHGDLCCAACVRSVDPDMDDEQYYGRDDDYEDDE